MFCAWGRVFPFSSSHTLVRLQIQFYKAHLSLFPDQYHVLLPLSFSGFNEYIISNSSHWSVSKQCFIGDVHDSRYSRLLPNSNPQFQHTGPSLSSHCINKIHPGPSIICVCLYSKLVVVFCFLEYPFKRLYWEARHAKLSLYLGILP